MAVDSAVLPARLGAEQLPLRLRDSRSGIALAGDVAVRGIGFAEESAAPAAVPTSAQVAEGSAEEPLLIARADSTGWVVLDLPPGRYRIEAGAAGHLSPSARVAVGTGEISGTVFWLDPLVPPEELQADRIAQQLAPGVALLHGHLVDSDSGQPVAGAEVRLEGSSIAAASDERGYFALSAPALPAEKALGAPAELRVAAAGYRELRWQDVLLIEGDTHFLWDLTPGEGTEERAGEHGLLARNSQIERESPPAELATVEHQAHRAESDTAPVAPEAQIWDPPDSIRVGYADSGCTTICCTGSCPYTCVYSLETYVKRGLNDEWISSWTSHSLRSGAIPYRTYGSYRVEHPASGNYDICSSACCQVNDSDTAASTDSAAELTAGILLEKSGAIAFAEYSAENNSWDDPDDGLSCSNGDLSCGDGAVGSPAYGWPCLTDAVAAGHGCFGHGRGTSQWGTSRWASTYGESWKWITNHYYNGDGDPGGNRSAYMTSPLRIDSVAPDPDAVLPGDTFWIDLAATNLAGSAHTQVLLGASLYAAGPGWISDPPNDLKVALAPGANATGRSFAVPLSSPLATYDLVVALWLDVDQDDAITGADLSLISTTVPAALSVVAQMLLFADGFESADTSAWSGVAP